MISGKVFFQIAIFSQYISKGLRLRSFRKRPFCPEMKQTKKLVEHDMYMSAGQLVPLPWTCYPHWLAFLRKHVGSPFQSGWARNEDIDLGGRGRFRPPCHPAKNIASKKKLSARKRLTDRAICPPVFLLASFFSFSQPSC